MRFVPITTADQLDLQPLKPAARAQGDASHSGSCPTIAFGSSVALRNLLMLQPRLRYACGFWRGGNLGGLYGISSYGMRVSKSATQLSRARFLSSDRTMYQGACGMSVAASMASRARE
jgi:hypothetical protein